MNFLGHLYLSGYNTELMLGNFSGDFLKGNSYKAYPANFQKGVLLHRAIDSFTDTHPITRECKLYFSDKYQKYAGIVTDIIFDFFLIQSWELFSTDSLYDFRQWVHNRLKENIEIMPTKAQKIIPNFIQKKWLETYATLNGIELVLSRMAVRTSLPAYSGHAMVVIKRHYNYFLNQFIDFYYDMIDYVNRKYELGITPNNNSVNN